MRILVSGGAGYVGSVTVERLLAEGHAVVILDDCSTGHAGAVPVEATFSRSSYADQAAVERLLRDQGIEAILHCAARSLVGESIRDPAIYYRANIVGGIALLEAARAAGVNRFVFSSTAAVYGVPETIPITESAPLAPINPYGESKRTFEGALRWYGTAYGLRSVALRYFNVAGATERNGESHDPETHLIPNILAAVESGRPVTLFGDDYPTPDGTPIRDYIHVEDLATAHLSALEATGSEAAAGDSYTALQPGHGQRLQRAPGAGRGRSGDRHRDRLDDRPTAGRRSARPRGRRRPRPGGPRLDPAAGQPGRDDRLGLGLAPGTPRRLPGSLT